MRISKEQKTGIDVLNVNIILNQLKKDNNIKMNEHIK